MKKYVVYYDGEITFINSVKYVKGYYAAKQPHYEWSFTENINDALFYKSKGTAIKRKNFIYKNIAKIFEVDVITNVNIINEIL